jgi:hypothetical protein
MLEGPFAHAHGSIGYPKTAQTGNCFINGRAPQWALDVLKSRAHGADSAANGGDLTLTHPVWRNATCDERNMPSIARAPECLFQRREAGRARPFSLKADDPFF